MVTPPAAESRARRAAAPAARPGGAVVAGGTVTAESVRSLAGRLLADDLIILPVRHHSPSCAWQVRHVIAARGPSEILVEGPRGFDPLIPLLVHPQARMPLAVYTYAAFGAERHSAFYPFCDYSPELVALREGGRRGLPCRFIDLDFAEQCLAESDPGEHVLDRPGPPGVPGAGPDRAGSGTALAPRRERSLLDERHLAYSRRLHRLAQRLGCRDHEDLWERLFEIDPRGVGLDEHVARVATYAELARQDHTAADLAADGVAAREAEMAWHIRAALDRRRAGDGPVLVVTGGFHAIALPDLLYDPPPRPNLGRPDLGNAAGPGVDTGAALVRYSYERLERLHGYAAGMTAPAWWQRVWERLLDPVQGEQPRESAALAALFDITAELRSRHGQPVAVPAVVAAYEQALRLAHLRGRPGPLRSDLLDAVTSCLVKGDVDVEGAVVRTAIRRTLTGEATGTLPPGTGTPPLVADVLARLRVARLRVDGPDLKVIALDLYRKPAHRRTSRVLHGLALLGVPFAARTAGPDFVRGHGLGRLREQWEYRWTPATEGALVEAAVFGSTLDAAVTARFEALLTAYADATPAPGGPAGPAAWTTVGNVFSSGRPDAAGAVDLLTLACTLGLHRVLEPTLDVVREAIAAEPSFPGIAAAATRLGMLREAQEPLEAWRLGGLSALIRTAFERALHLGRDPRGDGADPLAVADALLGLRELLVGEAGDGLDETPYWGLLRALASGHDQPLVRGAATGLAYSARRLDASDLARAVGGHLSGTVAPGDAVGFLVGLLRTAREAAWQDQELLARLDERLEQWDAQTFVAHLPELRLAFAGLTPAETDRVARAVGHLHGTAGLGRLSRRDVDERTVQQHLEISGQVAELLDRDGLASWGGHP